MLTLSVGSASCSEDEPIQGTGQQVTPGNGSGSGDNGRRGGQRRVHGTVPAVCGRCG